MPYVCEDCVVDSELRKVVRENLVFEQCDYCKKEAEVPVACDLDDVVERVRFAIEQEYGTPDEETMYDPEEGDYHGDVLCNTELFWELDFPIENMKLQDDIIEHFSDERFCRKGMLSGSESERQMDAWHGFKRVVKNQRRYTFWKMDQADDGIFEHPPSLMVRNVTRTIGEFDFVKTLDVGTAFWRVRVHDKAKRYSSDREMAAPNCDQAIYSNRMSPAGVSMFYGADDFNTAIRETLDPEGVADRSITVCSFKNIRPLTVLDLLNLPSYNFFSNWRERERESFAFLEAFQRDISAPVKKDGRQHIEYVPTQVFTEYVRYELETSDGDHFDGIRFRSSKDGNGCYVLFCDQDDCLPDVEFRQRAQRLEFDRTTLRRLDAEAWLEKYDNQRKSPPAK